MRSTTNLHTIRTRKTATDRIASAIQTTALAEPDATVVLNPTLKMSSATSRGGQRRSVRLAACDGVNHQDFVLLARDFLDAFTGRHVKRLRAGLGFVFGDYLVHFFHVDRCWIVFEKHPIAVGRKRQNLRFHVWP